jgi:hypothetical protein
MDPYEPVVAIRLIDVIDKASTAQVHGPSLSTANAQYAPVTLIAGLHFVNFMLYDANGKIPE